MVDNKRAKLKLDLSFELRSSDSYAGDVVFDVSPGEPTQEGYDRKWGKGLRELLVRRYVFP